MESMTSPMSFVKNTRQTYSKQLEEVITEVQVQFNEENPTWIPYNTYLSILDYKNAKSN
jgi:hypothetical protein